MQGKKLIVPVSTSTHSCWN